MITSHTRCASLRRRALTGVSAVALAIMIGQGPVLADERERPSWLMLEFGYDIYAGDVQDWTEGLGNRRLDVEPDDGLQGAVGLVTPLGDTDYDIGIFARFGGSFEEKDSTAATVYNILGGGAQFGFNTDSSVEHNEHRIIVDFEARRDIGLGDGIDVTAKAGVRFAYFEAETDTVLNYVGFIVSQATEERESRFVGAGPRLGFDAVVPLTGAMQFDFSGEGSVLFGNSKRRTEAIFSVFPVNNAIDKDTDFRVVPTVGGTAALSFTPEGLGGMKFTVGFRAEAFFNVYDQRVKFDRLGGNGFGEKNAHRFQFGPFARVSIPLDGL